MASDLEEQRKVLVPILQRATEIEAMEPRVAYYCRLYALKRALEFPAPAEPIRGLIKALFDQCEKDKPKVSPNEATDKEYVKNFAITVFNRADKLDRAKRADLNTAKCFYAAAIFLQVLEQFLPAGEELELHEPEAVEKARYALWRAAELRKAVREGRPPAPPPEPADVAAAVAGAAAEGAYGSSGGGAGGDLFGGPAYDAGGVEGGEEQQPPAAPPVATGDPSGLSSSAVSSTEEFLNLPRPPTTVPPAGSVGLVEPAAAAGPRFRPGSHVWCEPQGEAALGGGPPLKGTVGQLVSPDGGVGGQALYKVALQDHFQQLPDSQLAPDVAIGARVVFIDAVAEHPQPASVLLLKTDAWPCRYLLQLDAGGNVQATGGQMRLDAPPDAAPHLPPHTTPAGGRAAGGGYPSIAGIGPGTNLPAAPPLVGGGPTPPVAPPPAHYQQQPPHQTQQQQQRSPAAAPPGPSPYGSTGGGSRPGQYGAGGGPAAVSAGLSAALDSAVQAAASGSCQPSAAAVSEAQKCAKFAMSSLNHDDVSGAVKFLADALRALTQSK